MAKTSLLLLAKLGVLKLPPEAWDAIIPHGPKVSQTLVEYMAAGVVRDIASLVTDRTIKAKLMDIGKGMANSASKGLVRGWEDGDDICPPWPPFPPRPWPWWEKLGPQPDPWKVSLVEQIVLADLLMSLAGVTTNRDFSVQLKDAASAIVKGASPRLVEDFEKGNVSPRS